MEQHGFSDVMKQWHRMCKSNKECDTCEIWKKALRWACSGHTEYSDETIRAVETIVTEWAAEHPEIVYPTWEKWLIDMGVLDADIGYSGDADGDWQKVMQKMYEPIPEDMARRLGLVPEEPEG